MRDRGNVSVGTSALSPKTELTGASCLIALNRKSVEHIRLLVVDRLPDAIVLGLRPVECRFSPRLSGLGLDLRQSVN